MLERSVEDWQGRMWKVKLQFTGSTVFISVKGFVNWRIRKQAFLLGGVLRINTLGNLQCSN